MLAPGRSILLMTGMISILFSKASQKFAIVWACTPWLAATRRRIPSHTARLRETKNMTGFQIFWLCQFTSAEKSTCPGVSMRFKRYPLCRRATVWALTVIPRSRSTCSLSNICFWPGGTTPQISRILSASVDLPWSTWATILKRQRNTVVFQKFTKTHPKFLILSGVNSVMSASFVGSPAVA